MFRIEIWKCYIPIYGASLKPKGNGQVNFMKHFFELEGVRNEEKGAFLEQNISLALLYNIKAISETS